MVLQFVRQHAAKIAYVAIGVVLFFAFLLATFPYADTLTRILAPMGLRMSSREQGISFPYGLRMNGVMLDSQSDGRRFFQSDNTARQIGFRAMRLGVLRVRYRHGQIHSELVGRSLH